VRVHSEHFFASLKGRFQSLRDLRIQIQKDSDLKYANSWIRSCLILHNMIIDIEEELGIAPSATEFAAEYPEDVAGEEDEDGGEDGEEEEAQGRTPGQQHRHSLMQHLLEHV
jgi:hypothetical protein